MKRNIILFLSLLISMSCMAGGNEKKYKKLINKYDVADEAKAVESFSPTLFWQTMLDNNELLMKFFNDMQKKRGAEKEALRKIAEIPRFYPQYEESIFEDMQGFCDTLLIDMGIADLKGIKCSLHVVYSQQPNAYTALTEGGFAMCLTSGLILRKGVDYNILMGYVAHEFVHGALLHHIRSLYAEAKERRKNELFGGIAAGLNAIAAGAEAYNAAAYGTKPSGYDYGAAIAKIGNDISESTLKYSFKFSREQEIEADLIAYRFLENLGRGEDFINGLRILGTDYDFLYNDYSDHPTIANRIGFLTFVRDNPTLGNTKNEKLRKERLNPDAW